MKKIRLATDVGGTFTDLVYYEIDQDTGRVESLKAVKAHTTPPNFEQGVLNAVQKAGVSYQDIELFAHGTTVVINALTEKKGVKTALITTEGFKDILEIARGNRPDFFNLRYKKPEPFIPRYLRKEVSERMTYKGEVIKPLDLSSLPQTLAEFKDEKVEAIAICLLHAYSNPAHELEVVAEIKRLWPEVSVVSSHEITREWREYERTNTTALCAYIKPIAEDYLVKMEDKLSEEGFKGAFYVMQSNGGIDTVSAAKAIPITMVESGPASGMLGAAALGRLINEPNIIALDIGGTTAKCSLINNGQTEITSQYMIERSNQSAGYPIMTPVVDLVEIGNGGGSIAWLDPDKKLHVGPQSAGASPGPVAYGKGGTKPTTTDANLMLGRINPHYFIGGEIEADMKAVETSFEALGSSLGLSALETAQGVIRIANHNMTNALKLISINKGHDPRDFTMVAFGGGGAMHAVALAMELDIPKVIIPAHASVFSAWGMLMSDLRRDYILTKPMSVCEQAAPEITQTFDAMENKAKEAFLADQVETERLSYQRFVDMRYIGQEHTVSMPVKSGTVSTGDIDKLISDFHEAYEREYTYRLDLGVDLVSFHLTVFGSVDLPEFSEIESNDNIQVAVKGSRLVDFDEMGQHEATIYNRDKFLHGMTFKGPAIIEEDGSTTVVFPEQSVEIDSLGNIHITL